VPLPIKTHIFSNINAFSFVPTAESYDFSPDIFVVGIWAMRGHLLIISYFSALPEFDWGSKQVLPANEYEMDRPETRNREKAL